MCTHLYPPLLRRYAAFITHQEARVAKARQAADAGLTLPPAIAYRSVPGLSIEEVEKLEVLYV